MALISIALATYNGELFIDSLIKSLLAQVDVEFEIVVSDDDSSDSTMAIINSFPDQRILVLPPIGRRGVIRNFDRAASACRGDYIAFADQDDFWKPNKLSKLYASLRERERIVGVDIPLLAFSDIEIVDDRLEPMQLKFFGLHSKSTSFESVSDFIYTNHIPGCSMLLNRSLLDLALPFPESFRMHDWWVAMTAICFGEICYTDDRLVLYRQHESNTFGVRR